MPSQRTNSQTPAPEEPAPIDHRKRRRNRLALSCVNCHQAKRSCDRKRPCSRCVQLGITGLCVYEVDKDVVRDDPANENIRLRKRIAELESVVRGLKNNPHPRWAASGVPTEDLPKMYRKRFREQQSTTINTTTKETKACSPTAAQQTSEMNYSGKLTFDRSSPATSEEPGRKSPSESDESSRRTSSEAIFIPSAQQYPPSFPTTPFALPDIADPMNQAFFMESSLFAPLSSDVDTDPFYQSDLWLSGNTCDDWIFGEQQPATNQWDRLGALEQAFLNY